MKKTFKALFSVVMVIGMAIGILAMSGCGGNGASEGAPDKIVMTYVSAPLNVPSILDQKQGTYKDAFAGKGIAVEYSDLTSGADQIAALESGDIQILNAVGGSSVLIAAANNSDIVILSMYSTAPGAFAMYSNDENINSPEDLRGLTIAGPKGTNLHELLAAYLATAGMTTADVDYVSMDIPSASAALEGGSIDVALLGGAASYNAAAAGKHMICDGEGLIAATICTATTRKYADENPEIIKTFLDTQNEIVNIMNENPQDAIRITAEALTLEESAVSDMYEMYDFSTEITNEDIEDLKNTEQFLYDSGMIESHVEVGSIIYDRNLIR